jgi:hypothetical protein
VEYSNIHNYDATMIPPEWHGWMHHVFDETPTDAPVAEYLQAMDTPTSAIYNTHVGKVSTGVKYAHEQTDVSQYRQRGYKVGSLMTGENEPDRYYKQPGHALSPDVDAKGGRFKHLKSVEGWSATDMTRGGSQGEGEEPSK